MSMLHRTVTIPADGHFPEMTGPVTAEYVKDGRTPMVIVHVPERSMVIHARLDTIHRANPTTKAA